MLQSCYVFFLPNVSNQNVASCFIIATCTIRRFQSCKSSLQALSVLTVCWKPLVPQNPTLMAFYTRLYILSVLNVPHRGRGHVCEALCFHLALFNRKKAPKLKALLIERAAPFTVRTMLNFTRATPALLRCWLPAEISCLFVTGENLSCRFIGWHLCNGWRNSISALFMRFIFPLVEELPPGWCNGKTYFPPLAVVPCETRLQGQSETRDIEDWGHDGEVVQCSFAVLDVCFWPYKKEQFF